MLFSPGQINLWLTIETVSITSLFWYDVSNTTLYPLLEIVECESDLTVISNTMLPHLSPLEKTSLLNCYWCFDFSVQYCIAVASSATTYTTVYVHCIYFSLLLISFGYVLTLVIQDTENICCFIGSNKFQHQTAVIEINYVH